MVDDDTAEIRRVAVHVLGGGVGHDIRAPLERTTHHRRREGIVDDQGHAVCVRRGGEALDVEHGERRVGDSLAEDELGVGAKCCLELLIRAVRRHKGTGEAHATHGVGEKVVGAAVDGRARHHVIASGSQVEDGEEVRRHTGARQHCRRAALELGDLRRDEVAGGVLEAAVEVAGLLKVEELAHVLGRVVLPGGGLPNRHLARLGVAGAIATLHAHGPDGLGGAVIGGLLAHM